MGNQSFACALTFFVEFSIEEFGKILKVWENWKGGEAIAILREIGDNKGFNPRWVSLVNGESDSYELHFNPESIDLVFLKQTVENHNLALKEINGLIVVYSEHNGFQKP